MGIALREMRGCGHFTLLDWTRACVMCVERAVSSPCVSRVCARVPSRVLTVRESSMKGLEGVQSSGPGALYRRPSLSQHFWRVRRAPSPLRRLRTSNNYNMQLVGRRRTRYAGVLGHLCSETRTVLLLSIVTAAAK